MLTKPKRIIDRKYREFIKTKRCLFPCYECVEPIDPAHITPRNGTKGMGSKVSDYRCVPLCRMHHERYGSGGNAVSEQMQAVFESFIERYNKEYDSLFPQKVKRQRKTSARAKVRIEHCVCNQSHTLPWNKATYMPWVDGRGHEVWFECPLRRVQVKAKTGEHKA